MNKERMEFEEKIKWCVKKISVGQYNDKEVNIGYLPAEEVVFNWHKDKQLSLIKRLEDWAEEKTHYTEVSGVEVELIEKEDLLTKLQEEKDKLK